MANFKNSLSFKKAELVFEEDGQITVIERLKDGDEVNNFTQLLKHKFEGCENLMISISVEKNI